MTTRRGRTLAPIALATMLMVALAVEPALAQTTTSGGGSTSDIGKNLGAEVQSWGKALLFGVAVLVGLPALGKRDMGDGMKVTLMTFMIGGFVFATGAMEGIIHTLWSTLGR